MGSATAEREWGAAAAWAAGRGGSGAASWARSRSSRGGRAAPVLDGCCARLCRPVLWVALPSSCAVRRPVVTWRGLREALGPGAARPAQPVEYHERARLPPPRRELGLALASSFYEPRESPL